LKRNQIDSGAQHEEVARRQQDAVLERQIGDDLAVPFRRRCIVPAGADEHAAARRQQRRPASRRLAMAFAAGVELRHQLVHHALVGAGGDGVVDRALVDLGGGEAGQHLHPQQFRDQRGRGADRTDPQHRRQRLGKTADADHAAQPSIAASEASPRGASSR
jgi:hypothetical protein